MRFFVSGIIVVLALCASCISLKKTSDKHDPPLPVLLQDSKSCAQVDDSHISDSILTFHIYFFRQQPRDSLVISGISKVKSFVNVDPFSSIPNLVPGKFRCSLLDDKGAVVKNIVFDNPLNKVVEWTDAEDPNVLHKKTIELDKEYYPVRTNYVPSIKYIQMSSMDARGDVFVYKAVAIH